MKKNPPHEPAEPSFDLAVEYDFSRGVRGRYATRYADGTNLVVLEPDVAKAFRDSASVNQALRGLLGRAGHDPKAPA
jgi:hypothetical protein